MKRLLDFDPLTGITEVFEATDDGFNIHTYQDVTPIVETNKTLQNLGRDAWRKQGDWRLEASIPIGIQYKWLTEYGIDVWNPNHKPAVIKKLNDPEWRYLKCAEVII
jgi:hypothetical protein